MFIFYLLQLRATVHGKCRRGEGMQWQMSRAKNVVGGKPQHTGGGVQHTGGAEYVAGGKLCDIWEELSMSRERSCVTYGKGQVCGSSPPITYKKVLMAGRHQGIEGRQVKQDSHGCNILMGGRHQGGTGEGHQ